MLLQELPDAVHDGPDRGAFERGGQANEAASVELLESLRREHARTLPRSPAARTVAAVLLLAGPGCASHSAGQAGGTVEPAPWTALFDGEDLGQWRPTPFGGEGEVRVADGALVLDFGSPLTGVTWTGEVPPGDYELELTATKLAGTDFFCGLTFPVRDGHLTLVLGGWGGATCGLSCLDGLDASENETRFVRPFERGRAYRVTVRVTGSVVEARIDGERVVAVDTAGRALSLRPEVLASRPLGLAAFATRAAIEGVRIRR